MVVLPVLCVRRKMNGLEHAKSGSQRLAFGLRFGGGLLAIVHANNTSCNITGTTGIGCMVGCGLGGLAPLQMPWRRGFHQPPRPTGEGSINPHVRSLATRSSKPKQPKQPAVCAWE